MNAAPVTSSRRTHLNHRPVAQYDRAGRKVAEFASVRAAALATRWWAGNISKAALRPPHWAAGGSYWRFIDGAAPDRIEVPTCRRIRRDARAIVQYSLDGRKLGEFASFTRAAKAVGVQPASVAKVANRRPHYNTAGGFVWRWADDPEHLFREFARTKDVQVRNRLVELHRPIVIDIAKGVGARLPRVVQFDQLVSAGTFGLIHAVETFDPARGFRFKTFAQLPIRGAMYDWLREIDPIPRLVRTRGERLARAAAIHLGETGQAPTDQELMARLSISAEEYERYKAFRLREHKSLSSPVANEAEDGEPLSATLVDRREAAPDVDRYHTSIRDLLLRELSLTDALMMRLLIVDNLPVTEVATMINGGVSASLIFARRRQIIARLRARFTKDQLVELIGGRAA